MTAEQTRTARCSCGQLHIIARGEPIRVSVCHCLACQQRTGSAFGYQARFHRNHIEFHGESREYIRSADSGNRVFSYFCPQCGSTVHYHLENAPDIVAIAAGAFADPNFVAPRFSVYESRRHHWLLLSGEMQHVD
jgi:hypothetical protein